jgi:hypothetical protein
VWSTLAKFSEKLFMLFCKVIFHLFILVLVAIYDCNAVSVQLIEKYSFPHAFY